MDKDTKAPIPERKGIEPPEKRTPDPKFVRGTINPPTKKER